MKVLGIIQARMGSTRLPGKISKNLCDRPMLVQQIARLKSAKHLHQMVIATSNKSDDKLLGALASNSAVEIYYGSEDDVLSRFYETYKLFQADVIVRLTGDCPLIEPAVVDECVELYLNSVGDVDFVSNTLVRKYPRGLDVEVFSSALLEKAYAKAKSPQEREHVTPYMYAQGHGFRIKQLTPNFDYSELRWTVDTIEDFLFVEEIYHALYPTNHNFTMFDVLKLLEKRPELSKINSEISQKNWHS